MIEYPRRGDYYPRVLGAACHLCPIAKRSPAPEPVPPQGSKLARPKLIILGEAPGYYESLKGVPFIGRSGMLLDSLLREQGFRRSDAYITNSIACRLENERRERDGAVACCAPRLARELSELGSDIPILALGGSAVKPLLPKGAIQKVRGFVWKLGEVDEATLSQAAGSVARKLSLHNRKKSDESAARLLKARYRQLLVRCRAKLSGRTVIPSLHPAFILRADMQLPVLRTDMERVVRWADSVAETGVGLPLEDDGPYLVVKTIRDLRLGLKRMRKYVAVDIESDGVSALYCKITCVGLSDDYDGNGTSLVLSPWQDIYAPILNEFFKRHVAVTHNGPPFDEVRLNRAGIKFPHLEDTLFAYHSFCGHLRKGLDHVVSIYCTAGPWKAEARAKGAEEKGGFYAKATADLEMYNSSDVRLTVRSWHRMQVDLATERKIYEFDMEVGRTICQQMQVEGLRIDIAKRDFLIGKLEARAATLLAEMRQLLRRPTFNPASLSDLRRALFRQCRVPTWITEQTPTGQLSTAKLVLERLRSEDTRAGKLADKVLRMRSAIDTKSEYLENVPVGEDGRVHASWKIYGSKSGRAATSKPNLLNMPRYNKDPEAYEEHVRAVYVAAPGCVYVYYDLKQSEPWVAAYVSGDPNFIEDVKSDVHTKRTTILFPKLADIVLSDPKGKGAPFRQITKSCGLAVTYLSSPETVHATCYADDKIKPEHKPSIGECTALVNKLKERYPGWYKFVGANVAHAKKYGFIRSPFEGRLMRVGFYAEESLLANAPCQSGVADIMGRRLLATEKVKPKSAKLVFYGYDSACYEVPVKDAEDTMAAIRQVWAVPVHVPSNGLEFIMGVDMKAPGERLSDF